MMIRALASLSLLTFALAPAATAQQRLDARTFESVELEMPPLRGRVDEMGVRAFAFDPTGRRIAGGIGVLEQCDAPNGGDILIWDAHNGLQTQEIGRHEATPTWMTFGPRGEKLVTFSSDDRALRVWTEEANESGKAAVKLTLGGAAHEDRPPQLARDGVLLVHVVQLPPIGHDTRSAVTGALEAWDLDEEILRWKIKNSHARAFAIAPDSQTVAVWIDQVSWREVDGELVGERGRTALWMLTADAGQPVWEMPTEALGLNHLFFTPDGMQLIGVSHRAVYRFSARDGSMIGEPLSIAARDVPRRVTLLPDGRTLLLARAMGQSLDIYDLAVGALHARIDFSAMDALGEPWFAPDGSAVAGRLGEFPSVVRLQLEAAQRR